jgi:GTP-binding protein
MLANKKDLAKTSSTPGKTQLINHFLMNKNMFWVDLPGYGFAKVAQKQRSKWMRMIWNYIEDRENLMTLFVLIDSRHTPQAIDLEFISSLGEKGIPFAIIFTKTDKGTQKEASLHIDLYKKKLLEQWEELPPLFISSAVKRNGKKEILSYLKQLELNWNESKKEI